MLGRRSAAPLKFVHRRKTLRFSDLQIQSGSTPDALQIKIRDDGIFGERPYFVLHRGDRGCRIGIVIEKVVPLPGSLDTSMCPPCLRMMPWVIDKPRPVPVPTGLVVKKGSKMRLMISCGMPEPVSLISIRTFSPSCRVCRVIFPCSAIACAALTSRFMNT